MTSEPTLQAYSVSDDEHAMVVFGYTPQHAARLGGSHFGLEAEDVITDRAPEFDEYAAAGHVTGMQYLAHGWWMTCTQCQREVSRDRADELATDIEVGLSDEAPMEPQEHAGHLYCSLACREADLAERARRIQARADAEQATLARFPGVTIVDVHSLHTTPHVVFQLPGTDGWTGQLGWTVGQDILTASPAAHEAYRTYQEALK
ncbi:hypothetical protein ACMT4L_16795 [Deinococcus sp. A31D244]|uniref:hypothetical protein n=1 Tax=Deinococcus sp. A31D244 TaxID=3397675 RepID=UPI0039DF5F3D